MNNNQTEYNFKIKLDKTYNVRKWKAKEKREFLNTIKVGDSLDKLEKILVRNCMKENVAFNPDEFKYVLSKMRQISLGNTIDLEFYCDECKTKFLKTIEIDKIMKPIFSTSSEIKTNIHNIKIGAIKNPDMYRSIIQENIEYSSEYDFFLRIDSINSDSSKTLQEIVDYFDNLDIDEYDRIFKQWNEIRFKVDDTEDISCNNCNHIVKYSFDEIPGFFPSSWFE